MSSVVQPKLAYIASLLATTATSQSGSLTATVDLSNAWQGAIPVQVSWKSGVSADAIVNAYISNDGGVTFDTNPTFSIPVARKAGGSLSQSTIILPTGIWALQILNSGPSTGSAAILTAAIMTSMLIQ